MEAAVRIRLSAQLVLISTMAIVWNSIGTAELLVTQSVTPTYLIGVSEGQRSYFAALPTVVKALWTIGVCGGLLGSVLLLVRSGLASAALLLSLVGLLASSLYQWGLGNPPEEMLTWTAMLKSFAGCGVAATLLVYAQLMARRGLLR